MTTKRALSFRTRDPNHKITEMQRGWLRGNARTDATRNLLVGGPTAVSLVAEARRRNLAVSTGPYGTITIRQGSNTIQLWEQLYETHGADLHWWMQVRGPAFEDETVYPRCSYRLTKRSFYEALRSI
jgi:hypothetical protein